MHKWRTQSIWPNTPQKQSKKRTIQTKKPNNIPKQNIHKKKQYRKHIFNNKKKIQRHKPQQKHTTIKQRNQTQKHNIQHLQNNTNQLKKRVSTKPLFLLFDNENQNPVLDKVSIFQCVKWLGDKWIFFQGLKWVFFFNWRIVFFTGS